MNVITADNLRLPMPLDASMTKLRASLAAFAAPGDPLINGLLVENWPGPQTSHFLYSVGLRTLLNPNALDGVDQPIAWRYLAGDPDPAKATACWTTPEIQGLPAKVVSVLRGREAADVLASADGLNQLSEVKDNPNNHYEIRVLRIPALCLEAFWMKSLSAALGDVIVPYGLVQGSTDLIKLPGAGRLKKNQAYLAADFLKIAGEAARTRLAADSNQPPARAARARV